VEEQAQAGETFGTREIAFQRVLKKRERRFEPSAAIVDLTEAMQRIEAVRLMLEKLGVKPFGSSEFSLFLRPPGAPQQARRIRRGVLRGSVAHAKSDHVHARRRQRGASVNGW